ncbi:nSTAND1 domain-containing NTPase [Sorangium sp. So ce341]|uniref:serine/threonine-protein kinase n=1 Tax=Sorangium sp. So ce341 TaxID=3133302 RepID=UPI003F602A97
MSPPNGICSAPVVDARGSCCDDEAAVIQCSGRSGHPQARQEVGLSMTLITEAAHLRAVPAVCDPHVDEGAAAMTIGSSQRAPQEPPVAAGAFLGHYELIRELGRGGMGTVFLARDVRLGRLVAIKLVTTLTGSRLDRFLLEARATALCKHENIVTIYDVNEHDGYPYMVLEYIEGQSLRAWMMQRRPAGAARGAAATPLSTSAAVEVMVPVVRALACAHKLGIVHRDLKPENIMLEASGAIKVLDFGIAKLLDARAASARDERAPPALPAPTDLTGELPLTRDGAVVGTLAYMSPEQRAGEEIDHATDIWAVGIMLHELATGAHPFEEAGAPGSARPAALDAPVRPLGAARGDLGPLGPVIERCLRRPPSERFASAQQLLAELTPLLPGRREIVLGADERPFAGLSAFQEGDADRFFGREDDIAGMVARLKSQPLLAIVGASGVGKSSLVRAGIIPALKRSGAGWASLVMRPGREPLAALADLLGHPSLRENTEADAPAELARDSARSQLIERLRAEPGYLGAALRAWSTRNQRRVVLFVDQFEELYTLSCDARDRAAFFSCLEGVADDASSPLRVILSTRSDFIERVAEDRRFMAGVTRGLVFLSPIGREGLRDALLKPIQAARYEIEDPAMVDGILDVLETTRGALPLLQFTAARLWDMRDRDRRLLTRASYEAIGGVAGTLASHADAVLAGLGGRQAKLCRAILERLVTPERTRAIASLEELRELPGDGDPDELESVVHLLADARLLAIETGRDDAGSKVEIVHESLIARWPTLLRWLDENQEDAVFLDKLRAAARHWASSGGADDLLWRGKLAEEARRFRERSERRLPEREQRYLDAVIGLAGQAQRRKRNLIVGTIASLALLVVGATAGIVTVVRQNRVISAQLADIRRTEDSLEEALARETASRQAAEQARMSTEEQRRRAELLQKEAEEARDRAEAEAERARAAAGEARTARDEARTSEAEARRAKAQADDERARAGVEARKAKQAADDERRSKEELEQLIQRSVGRIRDRLR